MIGRIRGGFIGKWIASFRRLAFRNGARGDVAPGENHARARLERWANQYDRANHQVEEAKEYGAATGWPATRTISQQ